MKLPIFIFNGRLEKPDDLTSEALIRPLPVKDAKGNIIATTIIEINMVSFMATGPGRFANGAQSSIVDDFMSGRRQVNTGVRQVFSMADMLFPGEENSFGLQRYPPKVPGLALTHNICWQWRRNG